MAEYTADEFHKSIREAWAAILDACERHWSPNDVRNKAILWILDRLEVEWFPSAVRTSLMRKQWKEAVRLGQIKQ